MLLPRVGVRCLQIHEAPSSTATRRLPRTSWRMFTAERGNRYHLAGTTWQVPPGRYHGIPTRWSAGDGSPPQGALKANPVGLSNPAVKPQWFNPPTHPAFKPPRTLCCPASPFTLKALRYSLSFSSSSATTCERSSSLVRTNTGGEEGGCCRQVDETYY